MSGWRFPVGVIVAAFVGVVAVSSASGQLPPAPPKSSVLPKSPALSPAARLVLVACPQPGQIQLNASLPAGWKPIGPLNSMIRMEDAPMVRNPGDPGVSGNRGQLDCVYRWGYAGATVPFMQMFIALPENHVCQKTPTGAECSPKP